MSTLALSRDIVLSLYVTTSLVTIMFYVSWLLRYHNRVGTRGTRQSASTLISRSRLYTSSSLHRKSKSVLLTGISVPTHKASAALLLLLLLSYSRSWVRHVDPAAKASLFLMARYVISIWRRQSIDRNVSRWDTTKRGCMSACIYVDASSIFAGFLDKTSVTGPPKYSRRAFIYVLRSPCANIYLILKFRSL